MDTQDRMLRMLLKGKVPSKEDLRLGNEEFVRLVSEAQSDGLIEGIYISFCDSQELALSGARLTEKGRAQASRRGFPFHFR